MEENRNVTGAPPPAATVTPLKTAEAPSAEAPTSRRRGGGQKRKASAIGNVAVSTPPPTSSKRQAREKQYSAVPFPAIHNGPCTRAAAAAAPTIDDGVKREAEALAVNAVEELSKAKEDLEAWEARIEAEIEAIRSRDRNAHVVPSHAGWFSWTKVHPLEEKTLTSFFNGKSQSRTPEMYTEIRNWIMKRYHTDPNILIELKDLSELSVGDLDAKREVMEFLDYWGLINYHPFPQTDSTMNVDIDMDKAAKTDSVIDKLFHFESEETWTSVLPGVSAATPVSCRLFPDPAIAEELVKSEGPAVEYHCNSCSADCSRKRYHCQKRADFDLCIECFNNEKCGYGMSPSDFILMEPAEAGGASGGKWTDQETLLLLEALELYKENWNEIAEHVATKTKAQCILHFIEMPIEDMFMDADVESNTSPKEKEEAVLSPKTDAPAGMDAPETAESKDNGNVNPHSLSMETSKSESVNGISAQDEVDDNCALKALRDAFSAVGYFPSPGERVSFSNAGNPVMALAAFLVKLVEPNMAIASARSSLKFIAGNHSGEQLALRHCFVLEDPSDDGKSPDSDRPATGSLDPAKKDEGENVEMQEEEKSTSVIDDKDLSLEQNKDNKGEDHAGKKPEEKDGEKQEESNEKELGEERSLVSLSDQNPERSDFVKQSGGMPADKVGETAQVNGPGDAGILQEQESSTAEESDVLTSKIEPSSSLAKESSDAARMALPSHSTEDEDMMPAMQTKEPEQSLKSDIVNESEVNAGGGEAKNSEDDRKEPVDTRNDLDIDKVKCAAVTALSAAAVKAKFLANQEETHIWQLTTSLIEKQLHKLETKLAFFSEMENVVMRAREQLERSKQMLFHERAQIIATKLGISASSSRAVPQSLPANTRGMAFANAASRPLTAMSSQRAT